MWRGLGSGRSFFQVFLALALCQATAANLKDEDARQELKEEILDLFDPKMVKAMSRTTALAYCGPNLEMEAVENCPECQDAGFEVVKGSAQSLSLEMTYNGTRYEDANFFVLGELEFTDSKEGGCFVAVRGSFNKVNWIQNKLTDFVDPSWSSCPKCRLMEGYFGVYTHAIPELQRYFDSHGCSKSGNAIHVTGHSLGGGVAAILIAGLTDLGYDVALSYLLEPALAGDEAFRTFYLETIAKNHPPVPAFSMTNGWDLVPGFEQLILKGFRPVPYDIHSDPDPLTGGLTVCFHDDKDDGICRIDSSSWWYWVSLYVDHINLWYAPGHMQIGAWIPEVCKAKPNWIRLRYEWMKMGLFTTFFGSGLWGFVIKLNLLVFLCLCSVCFCCFWSSFLRSFAPTGYSKLAPIP